MASSIGLASSDGSVSGDEPGDASVRKPIAARRLGARGGVGQKLGGTHACGPDILTPVSRERRVAPRGRGKEGTLRRRC